MKNRFAEYITENSLAESSDRIILAVSGGTDSMVMAHLFISAGYKVAIAHCNFKLRGKESDLDEDLVRKFSQEYKVPFFSESFNTAEYADKCGISIQMAARELRFSWFENLRNSEKYDYVALAHNLNDNVETFILNLTRGTGIAGLTGMKPKSGFLIHPLLFATRQEIASYLNKNNIPFREDRSNSEVKYTRNKIRHLILPLFREINPSFDYTINEMAVRFRDLDNLLSFYTSDLSMNVTDKKDDTEIINLKKLLAFSPSGTVLFELFRKYGAVSGQMQDLQNIMIAKTGAVIYTRTHRLLKNRNQLVITPLKKKEGVFYIINSVEELLKVPLISSAKVEEIKPGFLIPSDSAIACVDYDRISFPVLIRKWEAGDSFYPLGMSGRKKISDYLIDRKYSMQDKEKCNVMESAGNIVLILGERIDNRYKVSATTSRILLIRPSA